MNFELVTVLKPAMEYNAGEYEALRLTNVMLSRFTVQLFLALIWPYLLNIFDVMYVLHISNVAIVCKKCGPTRIGYKLDGDKKIRVCRKCGDTL